MWFSCLSSGEKYASLLYVYECGQKRQNEENELKKMNVLGNYEITL